MKGVIILESQYTYEGDIIDNEAHGQGVFVYENGDKYLGGCKFGKHDGFGIYIYKSKSTYTGFFSAGKIHGIGTFEDKKNIYKGIWCHDRKHGMFYKTNKLEYKTYLQKWIKNKLINSVEIQYIQPTALRTVKHLSSKRKKYQKQFRGVEKKCIGCYSNPTNCANIICGHVIMCEGCLNKCDKCPICRAPITQIIRLFIS